MNIDSGLCIDKYWRPYHMDAATFAWDEGKASTLRKTLASLLETFVQAAQDAYGAPGEPVRV